MRVGFVGLGNMGAPMVANLLKAGLTVNVFDINPAAVAAAVAGGAVAAGSAKDVAAQSELVMTALPSPRLVKQVYLAQDGILAGAGKDTVLVDCSTIDPHTARELVDAAAARGLKMADAPISGGSMGAKAATLTFMVGADADLFAQIEPVLKTMGKNVIHCGEPGSGQVVKICNNLLLAISMTGTSEVMALGVRLGVDPKVLAGAINVSSGRCFSSDTMNPWPGVSPDAPASHGYAPGGTAEIMLKDVNLAVDAAREVKQPVILGAVSQQLYQMLIARGWGDKDLSAIIQLYRDQ
ncbi:3-hydroxyisobutyrate dehydrogenase [Paucimonas lemoignei]|uniref:3-hydroxyisobutyrate dehydrogenase n=1 Tax=Paucimonas lemoignei TaxID=29443 RepID=A0A4R3HYA6_PAULE|nr:3-hydroxyisobutyrate dehydrogenase [Paucimonas lemoignei]TCS38347.1 3-hydroxyisobutyrate dehydrogenase [Paucimonas lemoignei]